MNKYSKRALKTTATVGMSLAMVLSGMAAPVKAASDKLTCTVAKEYKKTEPLFTAEINGIGDKDTYFKETITTLKALPKTKNLTVKTLNGSISVATELQATLVDQDAFVKFEDASTITLESVTFKYGYANVSGDDVMYVDTNGQVITVKDKAIFPETVISTVTKRSTTEVAADVIALITESLGLAKEPTAYPAKTKMTITTDKGVASPVDIQAQFYVADAKGVYVEKPVTDKPDATNLATATKVKVVVVPTADFTDYKCNTTQIGQGLPAETGLEGRNVYGQIIKDFTAAKTSLDDIKVGDKVEFKSTLTTPLGTKTILALNADGEVAIDLDFKATLFNLSRVVDENTDEGKAIARFYAIETAMKDMFKANGTLATALTYDEDYEFKTTAAYIKVVELLEEFSDFETYLTNLTPATADKVTAARETLQTLVDGYVAENDGDLIDAYLTSLDKYYEKFVDENGDDGITKADVDSAIKNIKNGLTFTDLKGKEVVITKADYTTFKDNAGVEEYMTKFEDMYTEITAVKDAVSKTNEAYKELVKGNPSVKKFLTGKDSDRKLNTENAFGTVKAELSLEEFNILKAYKEEVLDVVFTMEAKEVGTTYVNKSTKSIFATKAQLASVLANISNVADSTKGILTALDKETGEFNWDKLVAHMDKVSTSYAALTKGIEKLDSVSLVTGDRVAILAADDAIYFLQGAGKGNLSAAETRTVNNAERKVTELMNAYRNKFGSLDVQVNGWVNRGNGDWAYYENGNAVTKWVAAGTNWFYVKDGVMLRNSWVANNSIGSKWYYVNNEGQMVSNTTVNGYVFDANGVWVKNPTAPTVETQENNDTKTNDLLPVEEGRG